MAPHPPSPPPNSRWPQIRASAAWLYAGYQKALRAWVMALAGLAGAGILAIIVITCADVVLRKVGRPVPGALDLVILVGAITMACALPYTTAVKGHVAIEFFYHKLGRLGRVVMDSLIRLVLMGFFSAMAWRCFQHGRALQAKGQVTPTLNLPEYWAAWVLAACCATLVLVTLHHLLHPGRPMIKP